MLLVNEEYKTFLSGRVPPKFDEDNLNHPILVDWYKEQLSRCILGYEHKGYRITGDHYFMLNFVPIRRVMLDYKGNPTNKFEVEYPLWTQADDRTFKQIEEARESNLDFMLMTARGEGKTYKAIALGLKEYICFEKSHSVFAGASKDLISPTFNQKLIPSLNELENRHLFLKQKRKTDTDKLIIAGETVDTGKIKKDKGRFCVLERIIFNTEGATAGRRATFTCFEEIGEFSGNPSLKDCINNTRGTANVGGIKVGFTMYIGTGGSVSSDQARDIFYNPEAYQLYIPQDCDKEKYQKGHGVFIPVYKKYGGFYEQTGYSDEEGAKKEIERVRKSKQDDIEGLTKFIQQYPLTPEEVFMKNTIKVFNSLDLAQQHTYITQKVLKKGEDYTLFKGDLEWTDNGNRVVFKPNDSGAFSFTELPKGHENGTVLKNLYCMGVDSIDMGNNDSADKSGKGRSKLAMLVKKRISPDFTNIYNNSYVCMYLNRSDEVEDDYENVMKCAIFFNAQIMLEYTRTNIKTYFKQHKQDWRFCKRPDVASSSLEESGSTIGFKATQQIINHYVSCIKHYLKETSCKTIVFEELLNQLIDYTYEDKGKFDLIAAMGGCELHDEQLRINHIAARESLETVQNIGWYVDKYGIKRFGVKPDAIPLRQVQSEWDIIDYIDETDKKNIKIVRK